MEDVKNIVARNIAVYRKRAHLTQTELAQKLNYSDKSISKWERGEGLPDAVILSQMAEIFGVSVSDLMSEHDDSPKPNVFYRIKTNKHIMISAISVMGVFFVATLMCVLNLLFGWIGVQSWLFYIYALPVSFVVLTVLSCVWFHIPTKCVCVSCLIWSITLTIFLSFKITNIWSVFLIAIPLQVMTLLGFMLIKFSRKWKNNYSQM